MIDDKDEVVPSASRGLAKQGSNLVRRGLDDLSQLAEGADADPAGKAIAEIRLNNANRELTKKVQELEQRWKEITLLKELGDILQCCNTYESYRMICTTAEQLFPKW